ncbi:MAG: GNAT family N-acetyltransferase [Candidatus Zixiibacteriota bacterium]
MRIRIRIISAHDVIGIRHAVLRPNQPVEQCTWPSDDAPTTAHFGAFADDEMVGIASIYLESQPDSPDPSAWRLRGMATLPEFRSQGVGGLLLSACIEHVENSGGTTIWCNARTPAVRFYERHGFECIGDEFQLPGIGPHYRMERKV